MRTRGKSALAISRWLPIRLEADADTAFEKKIQAVSPTNAKRG
jgi:hypothetical protein